MLRRHLHTGYVNHPYFQEGEKIADEGGLEIHHEILTRLKSEFPFRARLLDVGAGTGDFLKLSSDCFDVYGVEPSPELAEKIKTRVNCPVFSGAFEEFDPDELFDIVVLLDVIEHSHDPSEFLQKAHSVLKPGGCLIVATLDSQSILFQLAPVFWALSRVSRFAAYVLERIFCYQHNWYFNRRVMKGVVEKNGFSLREQIGYEFPLGRLNERRVIVWGLRVVYALNALFGFKTEQYLIIEKPGSNPES